MLYNAYSGSLEFEDSSMEYVRFGNGAKNLVMLPGLGDGLRSVKGTALPMAFMYREFSKDYTVYMFSRKKVLCKGSTIRDMALHQKQAMDKLGIENADIIGVSMGGMIAQHLTIEYPEKVNKLVLVVTCSKAEESLKSSVSYWIDCARTNNYKELMDSNLKLIYSEKYYKHNKWTLPLICLLTKPRSFDRFLVQAEACTMHDSYLELKNIKAPSFVIGGEKDQVLSPDESRVLAENIPNAKLYMYPQWGHGLYEEAPDFKNRILGFLTD